MADYRIGVIGIPGKWSTETLADAVEERTGYRLVIDMGEVSLDLEDRRLLFQDQDLCQLDALIVKKISATYSPNTLDRLELLRVAEQAGVRVFSRAPDRPVELYRHPAQRRHPHAGNPCHRRCRGRADGCAGLWQCGFQAPLFHQGTWHVCDRRSTGEGRDGT